MTGLDYPRRRTLKAVAAGQWFSADADEFSLGWLQRRGLVTDLGAGYGGDPERYVLTDAGRAVLAGTEVAS